MTVQALNMALVPVPDGDPQSDSAVAAAALASPTLQGIPAELRNKIYDYLALTTPRNVSGHKLLMLRRGSIYSRDRSISFWKQFQAATAVHPLTLTCRQIRTEFSSVLATTAGQTYCLVVDHFDWQQFELFPEFIATYCFSYRVSSKNFPPLLFDEVMLCVKMDTCALELIEANGWAARVQLRGSYGVISGDFSEVTILPEMLPGFNSISYDTYNSGIKPTPEAQAQRARDTLRRISDNYEYHKPDPRVRRLLVTHLNEKLDNRWVTIGELVHRKFVRYLAARRNAEQ
jgi:hypothetical protein